MAPDYIPARYGRAKWRSIHARSAGAPKSSLTIAAPAVRSSGRGMTRQSPATGIPAATADLTPDGLSSNAMHSAGDKPRRSAAAR